MQLRKKLNIQVLHDRNISKGKLNAHLQASVQLRYALQSLDGRSLIEKNQQNVSPNAPINLEGVSYTQQVIVQSLAYKPDG